MRLNVSRGELHQPWISRSDLELNISFKSESRKAFALQRKVVYLMCSWKSALYCENNLKKKVLQYSLAHYRKAKINNFSRTAIKIFKNIPRNLARISIKNSNANFVNPFCRFPETLVEVLEILHLIITNVIIWIFISGNLVIIVKRTFLNNTIYFSLSLSVSFWLDKSRHILIFNFLYTNILRLNFNFEILFKYIYSIYSIIYI